MLKIQFWKRLELSSPNFIATFFTWVLSEIEVLVAPPVSVHFLQGVKGPRSILKATKNFSSETVKANCSIFHRNAPKVVLSQVCSNGLFSINFGWVMGSWIYSHMPKQPIFAHGYKDLLLKNHWAKFFYLTHECLLYVDNSSLFKWSWFIDFFRFHLGKAKNN